MIDLSPQDRKTLEVIRDNPGKTGPELTRLYRPSTQQGRLLWLERQDLATFKGNTGWEITSKGTLALEAVTA